MRATRGIRRASATALLLFAFAVPETSTAVTTTWIADGDGSWTTGANWDNGEANGASFDAVIDDGDSAVSVSLTATRTVNSLVLGSDDEIVVSSFATLNVTGTPFSNDGTLTVNGGSVISTGSLTNEIGGVLQGDDPFFSSGGFGGTSSGVINFGTLAPGTPSGGAPDAGFLTIIGALTLSGSSLLDFQIGGGTTGLSFDYLQVFGGAVVGGDLSLSLFDSYVPTGSATFTILDGPSGAIAGAFGNVANGDELIVAGGLGAFTVNYGPTSAYAPADVVLSDFHVVPEPSTLWLVLLGLGALSARRRATA